MRKKTKQESKNRVCGKNEPMSKNFAVDCFTCGSASHKNRNHFWVINKDHTSVIEVCSFPIPKCLNVELQLNCEAQKSHNL